MTLSTQIRAQITATLSSTGDLGNPAVQLALSVLDTLADGVTNVQADKIYAKNHTIAASGSVELDMGAGGGMLDALGAAFEPAEVVALFVVADDGNTNNVVVGAAAAEPFLMGMGGTAPTQSCKPGGLLQKYDPAGWPVVNNTNDKLKLANSSSGTPVTASVIILARSA